MFQVSRVPKVTLPNAEDGALPGPPVGTQWPMGLINQTDEAGRRFGPGYFNLIIVDEAHRSVYQEYGAIFG